MLPEGFIPSVTLPRFRVPPFRPGRHFPGLLLAGLIFDAAFSRVDYALHGGDGAMSRPSDYDMTGWTHLCGPVGPGLNHSYPQVNTWHQALPAGWFSGGVCGTSDQALVGDYLQPPGARARYLWWTKIAGGGAYERFGVAEQWGRDPAAAETPAIMQPVVVAATIALPGVSAPSPPLVPVITISLPMVAAGYTPQVDVNGDRTRGFFIGALPNAHDPNRTTHFSNVVLTTGLIPDVRSPYPDPERKIPSNSRAGVALTYAFQLLSMYGTTNAFTTALWRALPAHLQTPHARQAQRLMDLANNWQSISLGDAFANSLMAAVGVAAGGIIYGNATNILSDTMGEAAGFGLYRAWATGERSYSTSSSFNPRRGDLLGRVEPATGQFASRYAAHSTLSSLARSRNRSRRRQAADRLRRSDPVAYRRLMAYRAKRRRQRARGFV